jgi:hypothetical protein
MLTIEILPQERVSRRRVANLVNRAHISTSTGRHISAAVLGAAVLKFCGAYFTPAEIEHARYVRTFADADVPFAGAAL